MIQKYKLLLPLLTICGSLCAADIDYRVDIPIEKDGRQWTLGYQAASENSYIEEYILEGQSTLNWSEMVVIQAFDERQTVQEHVDAFSSNLEKKLPPGTYNYKILHQDKESVLIEWWMDEAALDDAENSIWEILRMVTLPSGQHVVLRYLTKELDPNDPIRKRFASILAEAEIQKIERDPNAERKGALRNSDFAFQMDYPKDWQYTVVRVNDESFIFSLGAPDQQGMLQVQVLDPSSALSDDELSELYERFRTGQGYKELYQRSETLDLGSLGQAEVVVLKHKSGEWDLEERLMVVTDGERTVWFSMVIPGEEVHVSLPRLLEIIRSFQFTDREAVTE